VDHDSASSADTRRIIIFQLRALTPGVSILVYSSINLHQLQALASGAFNIWLMGCARCDLHRPTADAAVLAAAAAVEAAKATVTALVFATAIAALVTIIAAALLATS
jgi:hypothetical protein